MYYWFYGIIKESKSLSKDLPWIIIIMLFPIVGALLYIVIGGNLHKSKVLKAIKQSEEKGNKYFIQDEKIKKEIESQNNGKINYLMNYLNFPVTKNNNINYYKLGELAYPEMLKELKSKKIYIFRIFYNKKWHYVE